MACLYVLPLFSQRAYLHSPLCQLLSSNFNSSAHLPCPHLISYFLELLLSSLRRQGKKRKKKQSIHDAGFKPSFTHLCGPTGQGRAGSWQAGGSPQRGAQLHPHRGTSRHGTALRRADGLNLKPLWLFAFTTAHLERYTFLKTLMGKTGSSSKTLPRLPEPKTQRSSLGGAVLPAPRTLSAGASVPRWCSKRQEKHLPPLASLSQAELESLRAAPCQSSPKRHLRWPPLSPAEQVLSLSFTDQILTQRSCILLTLTTSILNLYLLHVPH